MKKIYLFCSSGMSTSMLASRMQETANANHLPVEVKAFSHSKIDTVVKEEHPDCILLGPQVKHLYDETKERYGKMGIPISIIDAEDYGRMRGDKVLKAALLVMKHYRVNH